MMKLGILPLGRATFDVPFAEEKLAAMLSALEATGHRIVGPRRLLMDETATEAALAELEQAGIEHLLVLQVTFTDAAAIVAAGARFDGPLSIWAVPEPRLGGRLRLNAFCGLNLASHALGRNGRRFSWLYAEPSGEVTGALDDLLAGRRLAGQLTARPVPRAGNQGRDIAAALRGRRIARIGEHPTGFTTCAYDAAALKELVEVEVEALTLDTLFEAARAVPEDEAAAIRAQAERELSGLDAVDQVELDRSLRLRAGLDALRRQGRFDAFAIRCWPETFTEYGGAVCGPVSMMSEARVPCACEADVYGALTQMILQEAAQAPIFLADLVDIDPADDTAVVWHCGQAPVSMRDPEVTPVATVHTNRRKPLLYEFPLKAGPVTFMRISQAFNEPKMVLGFGQMLRRPMAFTGTSGVVRYARPAGDVLNSVIDSGLEHHMALAYGDHREALRATAAELGLPVLEI